MGLRANAKRGFMVDSKTRAGGLQFTAGTLIVTQLGRLSRERSSFCPGEFAGWSLRMESTHLTNGLTLALVS